MRKNCVREIAVGVVGGVFLILALAAPGHGAGFGIFEQGTKAMGMAGAFTARADDPSAMFHNAAGIAFQRQREFALGFTWITGSGDFDGAPPFPGAGVSESLETLSEFPPHLYWVEPIGDRWTFGLGINAPFGLSVEWEDPDTFSGRAVSTFSELTAIDINPTIAWKANENFGLAVGLIGRLTEVELQNRQFTDLLPTPVPLEVAKSKLTGGRDEGYGFNLGILHRYNNSFSWGLSYRSSIDVDYDGELRLTQISTGNPVFDGILRNVIPFDQAIDGATAIEFPDMASLGFLLALSPSVSMEVDVNWTGWSSFDQLVVEIDNPALGDLVLNEDWDDVYNYRLGFSWRTSDSSEWRFGYVYDETPQPERTVSPVLPDSNRNGFTVGYGLAGDRFSFDVAVMYLDKDDREVRESEVFYFGTYSSDAWLVGVTVGF